MSQYALEAGLEKLKTMGSSGNDNDDVIYMLIDFWEKNHWDDAWWFRRIGPIHFRRDTELFNSSQAEKTTTTAAGLGKHNTTAKALAYNSFPNMQIIRNYASLSKNFLFALQLLPKTTYRRITKWKERKMRSLVNAIIIWSIIDREISIYLSAFTI